jgi:hypothetical protein
LQRSSEQDFKSCESKVATTSFVTLMAEPLSFRSMLGTRSVPAFCRESCVIAISIETSCESCCDQFTSTVDPAVVAIGAAGVHVHMTNTRLTDPEVLEEFSIRRGSGGRGRWLSGDGTRRVIRFLEGMDGAILSRFREVAPFGLEGGEPGERGENLVRRRDGRVERLAGCDQTVLEAGEAVIIVTPTGGSVWGGGDLEPFRFRWKHSRRF